MILSGVRVLDFGRYIAGPYCAALLGDFGADVIRIEKRAGSEDRFLLPVAENGDGALFLQMNRDKRSLTLDPARPEGREVVRRLVATADVVVANLPTPAFGAMGLDYESLAAIKPDIVLVALTAYGRTGPSRDRVGFDGIGQAAGGSAYSSGDDRGPRRSVTNFVDFGTALAGAYGAALALFERERTGRGGIVDASLLRTALNFSGASLLEESALRIGREPSGNRAQSAGPSDIFRTSDGWILIQVVGAPLFARIARLIGADAWLEDPRFATDASRGDHGALLSERVAAWCSQRRSHEALARLDAARVPCAPVYAPAETLCDPHVRGSGLLRAVAWDDLPEASALPDRIVDLSDAAPPAFARAPRLGEHTDEILRELGYTADDITTLRAARAI